MKSKSTIIAFLLGLTAVLLGVNLLPNEKRINLSPEELFIYELNVRAIDAETNKPILVGVENPKEQEFDEESRLRKIIINMGPDGHTRVTWTGLEGSESTFTLIAEGYEPYKVPLSMRSETEHFTAMSESDQNPDEVRMKKIQPAGAINSEAAASPR